MTPEEQNPKVHHQTARGARNALAHRQISQESYRAVLMGELSLAAAKAIGRDRVPDTPEGSDGPGMTPQTPGQASAEGTDALQDTPRSCLCGCGAVVARTFKAGHDARLRSELVAQIKKGDVLLRSERITDEQRQFALRHGIIGEEALPRETGEEDHSG